MKFPAFVEDRWMWIGRYKHSSKRIPNLKELIRIAFWEQFLGQAEHSPHPLFTSRHV